jgi:hypothetical protein
VSEPTRRLPPAADLRRADAYALVLGDIDRAEAILVEALDTVIRRYQRTPRERRALLARDYSDLVTALDHVRATRRRLEALRDEPP